jgi:hypothetical protein
MTTTSATFIIRGRLGSEPQIRTTKTGEPCHLHCNREMKWNCTVTAEKVCHLKAINPKKVV